MTSTDLSTSLETSDCWCAEAGRGRQLDNTGVLCLGEESLVGNNTSETTYKNINQPWIVIKHHLNGKYVWEREWRKALYVDSIILVRKLTCSNACWIEEGGGASSFSCPSSWLRCSTWAASALGTFSCEELVGVAPEASACSLSKFRLQNHS